MDYDSGYHLLFANPKLVEDLFRRFVPEPWVNQLDFTTLQRINAKLHADSLERRYPEEKGDSLTGLLFEMGNCRSLPRLAPIIERLDNRLTDPEDAPLRRAFLVWIKYVLAKKRTFTLQTEDIENLSEVHDMLATRIDQWEEEILERGLQKGIQKGLQQGESSLLRQQLKRRFGPLPDWAVDKLIQADSKTLECWGLKLLEANSLEEVFKE